jgi:hypothetical protein
MRCCLLRCMSLLLGRKGPTGPLLRLLIGVDRKWLPGCQNDAIDP